MRACVWVYDHVTHGSSCARWNTWVGQHFLRLDLQHPIIRHSCGRCQLLGHCCFNSTSGGYRTGASCETNVCGSNCCHGYVELCTSGYVCNREISRRHDWTHPHTHKHRALITLNRSERVCHEIHVETRNMYFICVLCDCERSAVFEHLHEKYTPLEYTILQRSGWK